MLVLARKTRETIRIGENIVITILKVQGRTIRVGIEAPQNVRVLRGEMVSAAPVASADVDLERRSEQEILAEAEALYTADGGVSASFLSDELEADQGPELADGLPEDHDEQPAILPLRRLSRRFPMGALPVAQKLPVVPKTSLEPTTAN